MSDRVFIITSGDIGVMLACCHAVEDEFPTTRDGLSPRVLAILDYLDTNPTVDVLVVDDYPSADDLAAQFRGEQP